MRAYLQRRQFPPLGARMLSTRNMRKRFEAYSSLHRTLLSMCELFEAR